MNLTIVLLSSGFDRLPGPGGNHLDPRWADLQGRLGRLPPLPGGPPAGPGHIPGVYPPASLASDLVQRERERIERLGKFFLLILSTDYTNGSDLNVCVRVL